MSKPIEIKSFYSKELAIKASKLFYDWDMKNSTKKYIGWFFIAIMQFGVVGAVKHNSFGILFLSTFLVIYWYYGRWYLRKAIIEKYYDKSNFTDQEISFKLDKKGIYYNNELLVWEDMIKVINVDDGVLLQTSTNTLFFEKESFKSKEQMQNFFIQIETEIKK
jgi:hypothetical protein